MMMLFFLITLLAAILIMNWRFLSASFGFKGVACAWSRIDTRDEGNQRAWFCPACRREERVNGDTPPPDCGKRFNERAS